MAEFTFEGEVESLTPRQLEFLGGVLLKRGLKGNKVLIEKLGKAGDNYAAEVKKITTILDNGETFKMIAKVAPTNELARTAGGTVIMFGNECTMYDNILPKLVAIQKAAGFPKEELFRFAKCFGTLMEPMNEIILLEDLRESNFEMLNRFTPLTNEAVRSILKKYATLHSLSHALKKQDPEIFDLYKGKLIDFFGLMTSQPHFQYLLTNLEADTISLLDNDKYKKACRGPISQLSEQHAKINKNESNMRYSVFIHGDCWTNNFMFRLKENVPEEAILIDYQLSRTGNPACDLMYMIFSCTDYNTRHQYYHEWIDYYHSELGKCLSNFGMNVNFVYNRDQLDADLRRHSKIYFATAVLIYSVLIRKPEEAEKVKEAMENDVDFKDITDAVAASKLDPTSVALYKSKIQDLVESYIELGYIV